VTVAASLLPPNAQPLERAVATAAARVSAVPIPLQALWNPWTCPIELLPWLAWGLSIDAWDTAWPEARKRQEVARAIELQRRKGTRGAVEAVLAAADEQLELVEWFEAQPRLQPHTFRVELPLGDGGGARSTAAFTERVVREVSRVKPLRSHLEFVQSLGAGAGLNIVGAARSAGFLRLDMAAVTEPPNYLTTETGEPLQAEDGELLEWMN
jgi:phage tail P2-like protein